MVVPHELLLRTPDLYSWKADEPALRAIDTGPFYRAAIRA